jgi:hypothetical protein
VRLALVADSDEFDGWATARRLKPHKLSLRRLLNLVWYYLTENGTKQGIEKLKADILKPLPGASEEVSEGVVEHELDMFKKAMAGQAK